MLSLLCFKGRRAWHLPRAHPTELNVLNIKILKFQQQILSDKIMNAQQWVGKKYYNSNFHLHSLTDLRKGQIGHALGKWSDTWGVNFNAQKTKVLTISSNRGENLPLIFNNMQLQVDSHKHLGLLFHNSLSWHPHITSLHQRAMRHVNCLRSISNLVPRFALFSIYNSSILPIFDYGSVVYDICSQSDALLLDSAQTTAAKIITGCIRQQPLTLFWTTFLLLS